LNKSHSAAWFLYWIKLDSTIAFVTWDFSVALGEVVEALDSTVFFFFRKMSGLRSFEWVLNHFTLASLVLDIVHVTLIVSFSANARGSLSLSFKIFTIEAFAFLLSSNVGNLLS